MPKAITYGRQSHCDAMAHANPQGEAEGLAMQEANGRRYWQCYLEPEGISWGGFIADKAVSAYSRPFASRPGGKVILDSLDPGDHLIFDKIDRMWRSLEDFVFLTKLFENRQINWHICNLCGVSIRRGTTMGDFLIALMVLLAEREARETSDRIITQRTHIRSEGRYSGNKPMLGMRRILGVHTDPDGRKRIKTKSLAWDDEMRAVMGLIVKMRDEEHLGWHSIWFRLNDRVRQEFGWPPCRDRLKINSLFKIERLYLREKQFRALGNPDPNLICLRQQFGSANMYPKETKP